MKPATRHGLIGCAMGVAGLAVALVLAAFLIYNEAAKIRQQRLVASMPPGWMALIRQRATVPPSVRSLEAGRPVDDDGAFAVYDTATGSWTIFAMDSAFARVSEGRPTGQDAFTLREVEGDATLDRWVRWAALARWGALELALQASEEAAADDLLRLRVPDYRPIRSATAALALRGWARAERGDRRGAERDLRAVVALGAMLARHEPTRAGFLAGRAAIHAGALGLQHLALLTRNAALADTAADAAGWSTPSTAADFGVLGAAPDSGFALAADTGVSLGWRAEALRNIIAGAMTRPSAQLLGFPRRTRRRFEALATAGGDFGRLAGMAVGSGRAIDGMGPVTRFRTFGRQE